MTRPSVLFATHSAAISGAEYVLLTLTRGFAGAKAFVFEDGPIRPALATNGLDVRVSRWGHGFNVVKRDGSILKALPIAARLFAIVLELARAARRRDVVYANSQKAFTIAAASKILHRRPLIWHLHDILDPAHFGARQVKMQVALANRFAQKVIVPSTATRDGFVAAGGRADIVVVVPNGIDDPQVDPAPTSEIRRDLDLPEGKLIGVFSRLAPWKGQHDVIAAMAGLADVQCIIVGSPLFGEEAYRDRLTRMVAEHGLQDRVHFLGQRSDVPRLMQAVDLVVHPSTAPEPFGLTLVEAMAVGTPVMATDIGASREILEDGKAGILIAANDPQKMGAAIAAVLDDGPAAASRAAIARGIYERRYRAESMCRTVDGIIDGVLRHAAA